jgi:hypothetical protein
LKKASLSDIHKVKSLVKTLETSPIVRRFDIPGEPQAWVLAHALRDMEASMLRVVEQQLPRLLDLNDAAAIDDALHELGEELRHILFHVRETRFFGYLEE